MRIVLKALLRGSNRFYPKLFITIKLHLIVRDSLEVKNISGILVSIDFEKAYDSVAHDFLFKV